MADEGKVEAVLQLPSSLLGQEKDNFDVGPLPQPQRGSGALLKAIETRLCHAKLHLTGNFGGTCQEECCRNQVYTQRCTADVYVDHRSKAFMKGNVSCSQGTTCALTAEVSECKGAVQLGATRHDPGSRFLPGKDNSHVALLALIDAKMRCVLLQSRRVAGASGI